MSRMPWLKSLDVGIEHMDREHRELFVLMGELTALVDGGPLPRATALAVDFQALVRRHFQFEEDLMQRHAYPGMAVHVGKHRDMQRQVDALVKALTPPFDPGAADDLLAVLERVYFRTVLNEDMEMACFILSHGQD